METGKAKVKYIAMDWLGWGNLKTAFEIYSMGEWKLRDIINPLTFALYIPLLARLEGIRVDLEVRKINRLDLEIGRDEE
jgi:hypothetical protein